MTSSATLQPDAVPSTGRNNLDRLRKTSSGKIKLAGGTARLDPIGLQASILILPEELELLSRIIQELNERFGTDFTDEDRVFIQQLEARLDGKPDHAARIGVNAPDNARLAFNHVVRDLLQGMIDTNFKFYKQVNDNPTFERFFLQWLFERYAERRKLVG